MKQYDVALVSCGKSKRSYPCPAKDMYTSPLFRFARTMSEREADVWFVLSAKYGLVDPNTTIEPYDQTLLKMNKEEIRNWALKVNHDINNLLQRYNNQPSVVCFAGSNYINPLRAQLQGRVRVVEPLDGMPMGFRLRALKEMVQQR